MANCLKRIKLQEIHMEKNTQWIVVTLAALALLVGLLTGAVLFPTENVVTEEKIVIQNQTVEVPVEVEVEADVLSLKDKAVKLCFTELKDTAWAEIDEYETLSVWKVSDQWNIEFDEDITTTSIDEIVFRKVDTLTDSRSSRVRSCTVIDEVDEDLEVILA